MHELDTLVQHEYARKTVVAAAELPPALFGQTMRYLRLFVSPNAPQRALTMDRAAVILDDLTQAIKAGKVEARGRGWSAPLAVWPVAFEAVFAAAEAGTVKLPLRDSRYLYGVIANQANGVEAKAEAVSEEQRRAPVLVERERAAVDAEVRTEMPDFVKEALAKLTGGKSLTAAISTTPVVATGPVDPLLGQMARVNKGKWKGKGGTIVRVAGDLVYVCIVFPRNGKQVLEFNKKELDL